MSEQSGVRQLRLVVTAEDYDEALRFYRDVLGMTEQEAYRRPTGACPSSTAAAPHWS